MRASCRVDAGLLRPSLSFLRYLRSRSHRRACAAMRRRGCQPGLEPFSLAFAGWNGSPALGLRYYLLECSLEPAALAHEKTRFSHAPHHYRTNISCLCCTPSPLVSLASRDSLFLLVQCPDTSPCAASVSPYPLSCCTRRTLSPPRVLRVLFSLYRPLSLG